MNISAICGLFGSAFLAIPAIRQELRRRDYARFIKHSRGDDKDGLSQSVKNYMLKDSLRWNLMDSLSVLFGLTLLGISFLMELF